MKSLLAQYREDLYRHAIAVREMRRKGECDGGMRPDCYSVCEHAIYCSEWVPSINKNMDGKVVL